MTDTMPASKETTSTAVPNLVLVASTVSWVMGILYLLTTVAIGIPAIATGSINSFPMITLVVGVGYCTAGYLLRKRRRIGGVIAAVCAGLFIALTVLGGGLRFSFGLVVNAVVLVLLAASWRHLDAGAQGNDQQDRPMESRPN